MRCSVPYAVALGAFAAVASAANPFGAAPPAGSEPVAFAQGLRAQYARVEWSWSASEATRGSVEPLATDRNINAAWVAGVRAIPRFSIGNAAWISGRTTSGPARSYPPADLRADMHPGFGYSATLHIFSSILFGRYRGRLDYVVFESEPELPSSWGGTADQYLRSLATARKAIREADPNTRVAAGGFASESLGMIIAKDWMVSGARTRDEALAFAAGYYQTRAPESIAAELDDPGSEFNREIWPRANAILEGLGGAADAIDLHFYQSYRWLPLIAEWFRDRGRRANPPYGLPLIASELGTACGDAAESFKSLVTARTLALGAVVWSPREQACAAPAAETFRLVAGLLGDSPRLNRAVSLGPELYHYVFNDRQNRPAIVAAWAESQPARIELSLSGTASAWNHLGEPRTAEVRDGRLDLALDAPAIVTAPGLEFRFATVSAASYTAPVATESIVAGFGQDLRTEPLAVTAPQTYILVLDAAGIERRARIFYIGAAQINFQIPAGTSTGPARIAVWRGDTLIASSNVEVRTTAPGLFSAAGDGKGRAAANLVADGDRLVLVLYGTGIRFGGSVGVRIGGIDATVEYAGPQPDFAGLDQVNAAVARALAGGGELAVRVTVDGAPSNPVTMAFR